MDSKRKILQALSDNISQKEKELDGIRKVQERLQQSSEVFAYFTSGSFVVTHGFENVDELKNVNVLGGSATVSIIELPPASFREVFIDIRQLISTLFVVSPPGDFLLTRSRMPVVNESLADMLRELEEEPDAFSRLRTLIDILYAERAATVAPDGKTIYQDKIEVNMKLVKIINFIKNFVALQGIIKMEEKRFREKVANLRDGIMILTQAKNKEVRWLGYLLTVKSVNLRVAFDRINNLLRINRNARSEWETRIQPNLSKNFKDKYAEFMRQRIAATTAISLVKK